MNGCVSFIDGSFDPVKVLGSTACRFNCDLDVIQQLRTIPNAGRPETQVRPLAESSKLKAESGLHDPLSFDSIDVMKKFLVF